MGLFANPLSYAGYPPGVTGTPTTQNASIRAATIAEANTGTATDIYISPATAQAATTLDFASPPAGGFGSTTPRPVAATTLTSSGNTTLATGAAATTVGIANVAPSAARTGTYHGGNSAQDDTVSWLNGAPSAGTQTFNVLGGTATGGTQVLNLGSGIGGTLTVNLANGATTTNTTLNIMSGVGTAGANTVNALGNTRITTVGFANVAPAAARTSTFYGGNSAQNDIVAWFNGNPSANTQSFTMFGGAPSGGTQTVAFLSGNASGGTQAFTALTGTRAGTFTVGTNAAHTLNIGGSAALLGFYGATAVTKAGATADIKDSLVALGLITDGGATPLNLDSGALTAGTVTSAGAITATNGNIIRGTAGNKDVYSSVASTTTAGANSAGTVTLVGGTATISTTAITASSIVRLTRQSVGATGANPLGMLSVGTISAGVSFIINAWSATDATALAATDVSSIGWEIVN